MFASKYNKGSILQILTGRLLSELFLPMTQIPEFLILDVPQTLGHIKRVTRIQSHWCILQIKFTTAALLKNVNSEFLMINHTETSGLLAKKTRHRFYNVYSGKSILNKPILFRSFS